MGSIEGGNRMRKSWNDMTIREFQTSLASSSPTPGGGTAAAIALGQASALAMMVSKLTLNDEKWKSGWEKAEQIHSIATVTMERAFELADEDSDAFDGVMRSFKLPKNNESQIVKRREEIRLATLKATEIPYETATLALELLELLPEILASGNTNAVSDVGVSGLLASAACKGAIFNVQINLASLPKEYAVNIRKQYPMIVVRCKELSRLIMEGVRDIM